MILELGCWLFVGVNYVLRRICDLYEQKDSLKATFSSICSITDTLESWDLVFFCGFLCSLKVKIRNNLKRLGNKCRLMSFSGVLMVHNLTEKHARYFFDEGFSDLLSDPQVWLRTGLISLVVWFFEAFGSR